MIITINHLNPYNGELFGKRWKVFNFKSWTRVIIYTYGVR